MVGNAAVVYDGVIKNALKSKALETPDSFRYPRAGVLALAAEKMRGEKYDKVKPLYIRRSWAEEKHSKGAN
jgi:tRNA threonylcarbamoyladenosine biosynthesis protein TsaB